MVMTLRRAVRAMYRRVAYKNWRGICPICEKQVRFFVEGSSYYRDDLFCGRCRSIPRQRALMHVIATLYPDWRTLNIHESSSSGGGASGKLQSECSGYTASQYLPCIPHGESFDGFRNEDLEDQTFADEAFDLVITQDVFEHLFHPDRAIAEIARTLKPGGAHIMSVPLMNKSSPSRRRSALEGGKIVHYSEPQYHGNPVDPNGSLVTVDWGYDIASFMHQHSGMPTSIFSIDDLTRGIRDEFNEIVVSRKQATPEV